MSRVVFLLEEYSMKVFLEELLPRLYPELAFLCIPHEGKQDLEKSIPRKLKAWREPGVRFCVVRDNDGGDCIALKNQLMSLCHGSGREDVLVRIACQELEAWYFGDCNALATAYRKDSLRKIHTHKRYREPDRIVQPGQALAELVPGFQKVSGARLMGRYLSTHCTSRSFRVLMDGVKRLHESITPSTS